MAAAAVAGGAALQAYGQIQSNMDASKAESANAAYYRAQSSFAQQVGDREQTVFYRQATQRIAGAEGAYAAGGVDISGSPLSVIENQYGIRQENINAIKAETAARVNLTNMRADYSQSRSDELSSFGYNALSVAPTLLNGGAKTYAYA